MGLCSRRGNLNKIPVSSSHGKQILLWGFQPRAILLNNPLSALCVAEDAIKDTTALPTSVSRNVRKAGSPNLWGIVLKDQIHIPQHRSPKRRFYLPPNGYKWPSSQSGHLFWALEGALSNGHRSIGRVLGVRWENSIFFYFGVMDIWKNVLPFVQCLLHYMD